MQLNMEKELFQKAFNENLDKNFDEYVKYFDFEYKHFFDFRVIVFQVTKCLILELDFAVITLTNHILERLLKQALISKAVGIKPIPPEQWNSVFEGPTKKYSSIPLGNSIELCKKEDLITEVEKDTLFNVIRELMRNGFSHADTSKVLANIPNDMPMFQASFEEPNKLEPITLNPKIIPPLQSLHIEQFAKANAKNYFSYVFTLLENIELRLLDFSKINIHFPRLGSCPEVDQESLIETSEGPILMKPLFVTKVRHYNQDRRFYTGFSFQKGDSVIAAAEVKKGFMGFPEYKYWMNPDLNSHTKQIVASLLYVIVGFSLPVGVPTDRNDEAKEFLTNKICNSIFKPL